MLRQAAESGAAFTGLIADRAGIERGADRLLQAMRGRESEATCAIVLIDPPERGEIPKLREEGFDTYLVRPVRPLSLLTQLFGEAAGIFADRAKHPHRRPQEPRCARASVLLAEDNDINALLARSVLEKSGCRVVHARDGAEAVAKAKELRREGGSGFDLVLMDIHMPTAWRRRDAFVRSTQRMHAPATDARRLWH